MFLKYLKRKSFSHLFAFYIFKFLKRKSFIHLFAFYVFVCVCKFIHKKKKFKIPLIASYTQLLSSEVTHRGLVQMLRKSDFILESKMTELNQNKK